MQITMPLCWKNIYDKLRKIKAWNLTVSGTSLKLSNFTKSQPIYKIVHGSLFLLSRGAEIEKVQDKLNTMT